MTKKFVFVSQRLRLLACLPVLAEDGYRLRDNDRVVYSYRTSDQFNVRNYDRDRREDRERREERERREQRERHDRREHRDYDHR